MFLSDSSYFNQLKSQLGKARHASVAVAFWGKGAERAFSEWNGESMLIICNLAMGGTNPAAIKALRELPNVEIRQLDDLHAKVIITDHALLVGSANVSANGLGLENGEIAGWREAGVLSEAADLMQSANNWFESLWRKACIIKDVDLENAESLWNSRRAERPSVGAGGSLLEQSLEDVRDRAIYLAIYRDSASEQALTAFSRNVSSLAGANKSVDPPTNLGFFENWPVSSPLPTDPDATLIEVYYGRRGKVAIRGLFRPLPGVQIEFLDASGNKGMLDIIAKRKSAGEWILDRHGMKKLAEDLKPWLDTLELDEQPDKCVPFYEFKAWEASVSS